MYIGLVGDIGPTGANGNMGALVWVGGCGWVWCAWRGREGGSFF